MKKLLALACLLLPAGAALADGQHVPLWLAEGASNRVYLLGSIHILRREDHPLPAAMDAAYEDAEALLMELDMDDLDPFAVQAETNRLGILNDGRELRDLLGAERYAEAEAAAAAAQIPLDLLASSEPWLAAITIEQMLLMRLGFNPMYGVEMHLAMKASQDGKEIEGLETVDEQLAFLDGLSVDAQAELLMQTLANGTDADAELDALIGAWRDGDVDFLQSEMLNELSQHPELYASIVADRNHRWVRQIEELLDDDQDYLVVVGVLHMIGEDGVPALLEARGIDVEQMHESL